ncbi:hypothetical protein LSTR_LSTR003913 [Laodelphax striatellus]|uniref:Uncharacterized protein n=1 Tax=Laodelphax striatellus TaxID=195883 RepID=A0A482X8K5_LAOST|nr:hypothetical protein LSTR_LSTR003913 [Laodelphax striatellus]
MEPSSTKSQPSSQQEPPGKSPLTRQFSQQEHPKAEQPSAAPKAAPPPTAQQERQRATFKQQGSIRQFHHGHPHHNMDAAEVEAAAGAAGGVFPEAGSWLCCLPCAWLRGNASVHKASLNIAILLVMSLLVASPVLFLISSAPGGDVMNNCHALVLVERGGGEAGANVLHTLNNQVIFDDENPLSPSTPSHHFLLHLHPSPHSAKL